MSQTTYGNDETGNITVVIEDTDEQEPKVFPVNNSAAKKDKVPNDDNTQKSTGRKRGSVTVSTRIFLTAVDVTTSGYWL